MKLIRIGILANTHGLRGEVKIKSLSDFTELRFVKGAQIYLQHQGELLPLTITQIREARGLLVVKFQGYDDINQVEPWKGDDIVLYEEDLHELEEDEAYFYELIDCDVVDMNNQYLGKVVEVIETGANAILRVRNDDKDVLIPYVKAFVKKFDRSLKQIQVEMLDGML